MPIPMQLWNMYRSRAIASFYQKCGIDVIPNLIWADERTYGPAFSGLPIGGTYAVANIGTSRDADAKHYFYKGLLVALEAVMPTTLLVYGSKLEIELPCEVIWYKNDNTARVRKNVPYITARDRLELQSAPDDAVVDLDEVYRGEVAFKTNDRYERAVNLVKDRNPLMYNDELEGFEPFYVTDFGMVPPRTNPPKSRLVTGGGAANALPPAENMQLPMEGI